MEQIKNSVLVKKTGWICISNIYTEYISYLNQNLKQTWTNSTTYLEKHHLLPLFEGGDKKGETILVTFRQHLLLHFYRWCHYRKSGDYLAFRGRLGYTEEVKKKAIQLGGYKAGRLNTPAQQTARKRVGHMNSPAQQRQRQKHLKTGAEGGKVNSHAQFCSRQKLGKRFGKQAGLTCQHPITREALKHSILWVHDSGLKVETPPVQTLNEIQTKLNQMVPKSVNFTSGLSSLIRGEEKKRYGWKLILILIENPCHENPQRSQQPRESTTFR